MALSFAKDIKPMFTALDQDHMLNQEGRFDLWDYEDVKANATPIYNAVKSGRMPPEEDAPRWPESQVATFKKWMDEGFPE